MDLTERHDLRGGATPWDDRTVPLPRCDPLPTAPVDIAIVGAGVMGAMLADRLAADGHTLALVDRRPPAGGSTAASTALVLWEADTPLSHLARNIGEDIAVRRWRRVHRAVTDLAHRLADAGIRAEATPRASVYLDGDLLDAAGLAAEAALRARHGFPSEFYPADAVAARFGIAARPAIVSTDSFEINPVELTLALLDRAQARGATISWPVDVQRLAHTDDGVTLVTDAGALVARRVILAPGYERAHFYLPPAFGLRSSYAIATAAGTAPLWRENAMLWEASEAYLYARADADGRVIAGGGDEDFADPHRRDALIEEKAATIARDLSALVDEAVHPRERWAAMFGASPDGLPAIGPARDAPNVWLASGFGGNGITFAALAADLLAAAFAGVPDPDAGGFDPYRFG